MGILSRADINWIERDDAGNLIMSEQDLLDTIERMDTQRAALEAWIWWDTKLADGEETALDYDKAVELTKRAGIEWAKE